MIESQFESLPLVEFMKRAGRKIPNMNRIFSIYRDRQILCHEGAVGASCFLLLEGQVDILKVFDGKRKRLASLGAGTMVGQMALVDRAPRSATIRARGTVLSLELGRDDFERLLAAASPGLLRLYTLSAAAVLAVSLVLVAAESRLGGGRLTWRAAVVIGAMLVALTLVNLIPGLSLLLPDLIV